MTVYDSTVKDKRFSRKSRHPLCIRNS